MYRPLKKCATLFALALALLFVPLRGFAQAPLKGKAVVMYATAEFWNLKPDKSMVSVQTLSMGQELTILPGSEKGSLKGTTYTLAKVRLESGKEGYVTESLVAREPILAAVTSNTANLYSQTQDAAVLPTLLPLGTFAAVWPVDGKPDFYLVTAYVKSAGAYYTGRYILASDVSVRPSDVNVALLLYTAEGMAQDSQKQKLLETMDEKYPNTDLSALVENLRRAVTPPSSLAVVKVSGSFTVQARLNLRDKPSTLGKVITLLQEKDTVVVDARTAEKADVGKDTNYWYRVTSPAKGWVFGAFITPVAPSPVASAPAAKPATPGMAYVPGGTFTMGDTAGTGPRDNDERPLHDVTVDGFFIGSTEVTQAEWDALMGNDPSHFKGSSLPVESVPWLDALAFCNKKSLVEGLRPVYTIRGTDAVCDWTASGYRLPTEAEWEYAARGSVAMGTDAPPPAVAVEEAAWYAGDSSNTTHAVGLKKPNGFGLFDMSGNVGEWCWDWYGTYASGSLENPRGPASGTYRIVRGGSWRDDSSNIRTSARGKRLPGEWDTILGFRLARSDASAGTLTSSRRPAYTVGPFEVSYYSGNALVKKEFVPRAAINYPFNKFLGIDSPAFSAVWKGTIEVFDRDQVIDINFAQERSEASLKIDDVSVAPFFEGPKAISYNFSRGKHAVQINFINHWHTTSLNVSFTQTPALTISQARSRIAALAPPGTTVYSASVIESGNLYDDIQVSLEGQTGPVFLVLTSSDAVRWVIDNPARVSVRAVFLDSARPGATVAADGDVPVFRFRGLRFEYDDLRQRTADLLDLFGWSPSQAIGDYSPTVVRFSAAKDVPAAASSTQARHPSGMVPVPGGTFTMGGTTGSGPSGNANPHEVTLTGFSIEKTEVTQAEWEAVMGSNPCTFLSDFLPVNRVSWFDAILFCNKKSEAEGLRPAYAIKGDEVSCDWAANGYRLPTEAEWEYAARGGAAGQALLYPGADKPDDVAWYQENAKYAPHTVGDKKPNGLGLYDMSGNLAEWCWDWWGSSGKEAQDDPRGPESGSFCVLRGGNFYDTAQGVRTTARESYDPRIPDVAVGFRVVRSGTGGSQPVLTRKAPPPASAALSQSVNASPDGPAPQGMISIPGGSFTMGDTAGTSSGRTLSATVSGFFLSKTELTQGEYLQFCQETGANYPAWMEPGHTYNLENVRAKYYDRLVGPGKDAWPIVGVSWLDAVAYCNWRSQKEGLTPAYTINGRNVTCNWSANGYRLPTETEWEYAAKSGTAEQAYPYAGSANVDEVAWYVRNDGGTTQPVGQKKPNAFGLYDMSGNAYEWCWDWLADYPARGGTDPRGPDSGSQRLIRGGSFLGDFVTVLVSARNGDGPGSTEYNVGFRLARSR